MDAKPSPDWKLIALGVGVTAFGLYFGLVGFELVPSPSRVNGPIWLALLIALVVTPTGLSLIVRAVTGAGGDSGDLPEDAPVWIKTVYWLNAVIVAAGMAALGSWVAFAPGHRAFAIVGPVSGPANETIGRIVFGVGAIVTWLIAFAFARAGFKKIFGKPR